MVQSNDPHLSSKESHRSPFRYMIKTMAIVTCSLTVAGGSWYVAVDLTSASDLTAIYNCSAFFAYAFSIPLLGDKLRFDKVFAVAVAIAGVLVVAYGDSGPTKHSSKSGGSVGGGEDPEDASNRTLGNIVIGVGSVLYGLYEVLYKKLACPPEGVSSGRGIIFANLFGSLIGCFTLFVLWVPLPLLHLTGIETFVMPTGRTAWILLISVLANASKPISPPPPAIVNLHDLTCWNSILGILPRSHLSHFTRPLFRRCSVCYSPLPPSEAT